MHDVAASKPFVILGQGSRDIRSCDRHFKLSIGGFCDCDHADRAMIDRAARQARHMSLASGKSCSETCPPVSRDTMLDVNPAPGS